MLVQQLPGTDDQYRFPGSEKAGAAIPLVTDAGEVSGSLAEASRIERMLVTAIVGVLSVVLLAGCLVTLLSHVEAAKPLFTMIDFDFLKNLLPSFLYDPGGEWKDPLVEMIGQMDPRGPEGPVPGFGEPSKMLMGMLPNISDKKAKELRGHSELNALMAPARAG